MDHNIDKDVSLTMSDELSGVVDLDGEEVEDEEMEMSSKNSHSHRATNVSTAVDSHLQDALDAVVAAASAYNNPSDGAGTSNANAETSHNNTSNNNSGKKRHHFLKELRVELLEEIVVEFIKNFTSKALDVGKTGKLQLEDVWYLIRRDPKKYCRVKDLLTMNEELRRARKAFDEAKY
uniref:Uncharacterized protein n=1 Tax=Romanomermis culicivorax TaxID=13658 RepID=A0A915KDP0_ROMCU